MESKHWSIRKTARREAQITALGDLTGLGDEFCSVVDYALATAMAMWNGRGPEASDHDVQIEWLEWAAERADYGGDGTTDELVAYFLETEEREQGELPAWFDDRDRRLLIAMVERRLSK